MIVLLDLRPSILRSHGQILAFLHIAQFLPKFPTKYHLKSKEIQSNALDVQLSVISQTAENPDDLDVALEPAEDPFSPNGGHLSSQFHSDSEPNSLLCTSSSQILDAELTPPPKALDLWQRALPCLRRLELQYRAYATYQPPVLKKEIDEILKKRDDFYQAFHEAAGLWRF
jgi:hypothetical protein